MSVAIKIENLSKQYRLGLVSTRTLSHDLNRWWQTSILRRDDPYLKVGETNDRAIKGESEYVWALRDINLEVQEGEVLGIIGKNGAGKSTLLKILSKVTAPTTGIVKARGRIASLLEVGTGFHQEMTGRENIFMNGSIMGMTKAEIRKKFDEIINFSGVERYVDTPVKRYSSGMIVRLGFAVAAYMEPEILVVDEVLAVGDIEFQKKAIGKMQDLSKGEGRTVLFVSHNMKAIMKLCDKSILLNNGLLTYQGTSSLTVQKYLSVDRIIGSMYENIVASEYCVLKVSINNAKGLSIFKFSENIMIQIQVNVPNEIRGLHLGVALIDKWKRKLFTTTYKINKKNDESKENFQLTIPPSLLLSGIYSIDVATFIPNSISYCYLKDICPFEVEDFESELSIYGNADTGVLNINCKWE